MSSSRQDVTASQPGSGKGKQREPPPTLFLHPSPAASHVSLPGILAPGAPGSSTTAAPSAAAQAQPSLQRNSSLLRQEVGAAPPSPTDPRGTAGLRPTSVAGVFPGPLHLRQESTRATDRTDALWAEMQATLEEVELSASGGTRVFGPDHEQKLAGLRQAQIALAQAWARSEADEAIGTAASTADGDMRSVRPGGSGGKDAPGPAAEAEGGSTAGTTARPGSSGVGTERLGAKLEEETELDILLARKRREANDRYFQRVNQGVLDVVAKLEEVATAMRDVEQESKDIWQDDESRPSTAKSGGE